MNASQKTENLVKAGIQLEQASRKALLHIKQGHKIYDDAARILEKCIDDFTEARLRYEGKIA